MSTTYYLVTNECPTCKRADETGFFTISAHKCPVVFHSKAMVHQYLAIKEGSIAIKIAPEVGEDLDAHEAVDLVERRRSNDNGGFEVYKEYEGYFYV